MLESQAGKEDTIDPSEQHYGRYMINPNLFPLKQLLGSHYDILFRCFSDAKFLRTT